jgi:5,10-methylenetetrahydromethanopterin reductase
MSRPSLGVIFHPAFPPETLADYARRAEAAGFDELWLWDDCFQPGALTSATVALAATQRLKVGIGIVPAPAYNPLFAAMEITTLARLYPGRFLPGFGHGVDSWMKQIGAAPPSSLKAIEETVDAVRRLLRGESVTMAGSHVHLDNVQMMTVPNEVPPLYVGAMREKTLQLAGRVGDGTILTDMSSPTYVRWAREHVKRGMAESGSKANQVVVYCLAKVNPDGKAAREAIRPLLASHLHWTSPQLSALGIVDEVQSMIGQYGADSLAAHIPEAWIDLLCAAGTPEQVAAGIKGLADAGADSVVLQPLDGDPGCLDEYIRYLMPVLRS